MNLSAVTPRSTSLNAKVGAVALALAAFFTLLLSHVSQPVAPLRLLAISLAAFAAWAFCDEMGLRKPLNRAGFVFFAIAVATKVQVTLGVSTTFIGRYHLLYATFLLAALLFWSVAFLHRQRTLKVVGAVGVLTSLAPIVALVVGHVVVGVGAVLGVESILSAANGTSSTTSGFVTLVERVFGIWGYAAAWLLWRGHIQSPAHALQ